MKAQKFYMLIERFSIKLHQFLGFHPISHEKDLNKLKLKEIQMIMWSICILIWISFEAILITHWEKIMLSKWTLGRANDILKLVSVYVAYSISVMESLFKVKKFKKLHIKIKEFERICGTLNLEKSNNNILKSYAQKLIIVLVIDFLLQTYTAATITSIQWIYYFSFLIIPMIACHIRSLQFVYFFIIIKNFILIIKSDFMKINEISRRNSNEMEIRKRLQRLKILYGLLWEITELFNENFKFSIVANNINHFVISSVNCYYSYLSIKNFNEQSSNIPIWLSFIVPMLFILFIFIEAEKVKIEASKISVLLHDIKKKEKDTFEMVNF